MNSLLVIFVILQDTLFLDFEKFWGIVKDNNPEYKIYLYEKKYYKSSFWGNFFEVLPQFNLSYSENRTDETNFYASASFSMTQIVFSNLKFSNLLDNYYNLKMQNLNYKIKLKDLYLKALFTYLNLLKKRENLKFWEKVEEEAEKNFSLYKKKYELNLISRLDYLNAKYDYEDKKLKYLEAYSDFEISKKDLLAMMGYNREVELKVKDLKIEFEDVEKVPCFIEGRDEYVFQKCKEKQGKISLLSSIFSFLPDLKFGYYIDYYSSDKSRFYSNFPSNIFNEGAKEKGFFVTLNFNLTSYPFDVLKKNYLEKKYKSEVKKVYFDLKLEYEKTLRDWVNLKRKYDILKDKREISLEAVKLAKKRYELGQISFIDYLKIEENYLKTEVEWISLYYDMIYTYKKLLFIVGKEEVE